MRTRFASGLLIMLTASALAWANRLADPLPDNAKADNIVVLKSDRKLLLIKDGKLLKAYRISLGFAPLGSKEREGDGRTPEGRYRIDARNADSRFHLSLHLSYPTPDQAAAARERGLDPGGMIMIHGLQNGMAVLGRLHQLRDWTRGCIAVTNSEIEEIWRAFPIGTPIEVRP